MLIVSPAQKYVWVGLWVGLGMINQFGLISQMRDTIGLVVGSFVIN